MFCVVVSRGKECENKREQLARMVRKVDVHEQGDGDRATETLNKYTG
jgi:hypothetical protein